MALSAAELNRRLKLIVDQSANSADKTIRADARLQQIGARGKYGTANVRKCIDEAMLKCGERWVRDFEMSKKPKSTSGWNLYVASQKGAQKTMTQLAEEWNNIKNTSPGRRLQQQAKARQAHVREFKKSLKKPRGRTGYQQYVIEASDKMAKFYEDSNTPMDDRLGGKERLRKIANQWKKMSSDEKVFYTRKANEYNDVAGLPHVGGAGPAGAGSPVGAGAHSSPPL